MAQVAIGAIHMASFEFPSKLKIKLGLACKLAVNSRVATIVFDIETSALPPDIFDEAQQEYLFREAEKIADEPVRETKRAEIRQQFNLWPFTAQVVCIAMLNADTQRGQVLFLSDDFEEAGTRPACRVESRKSGRRG